MSDASKTHPANSEHERAILLNNAKRHWHIAGAFLYINRKTGSLTLQQLFWQCWYRFIYQIRQHYLAGYSRQL